VTILHITNGDQAGDTIRASGIGGEVLPWRDTMHHGPFPPDLDLDAVSAIRARYFSGPLTAGRVTAAFQARNAMLRTAGGRGEVVLWFEHDLVDQLQILQLLDWFSTAEARPAKISMICIDRFPGIDPFRGLGQLNAAQMASLWPTRRPVPADAIALAPLVWAAFRASDPKTLEAWLDQDLSASPFLRAALIRHFQEYPWASDGLTRSERQILTLVSQGATAPGRLFAANMALETALFEGDLRTWHHIAMLCDAPQPLLRAGPNVQFLMPNEPILSRDAFLGQRLTITAFGQRVLTGGVDARTVMPRDEWLGGVHLKTGAPPWMWDGTAGTLILGV
jgi:hypothetical protein